MDYAPYIYANKFLIEEVKTTSTKCEACSTAIIKQQLRVTFRRTSRGTRYFHLECYTPGLSVRIHPGDLTIKIQSEDKQLELMQWVDDWNQQFEVTPMMHARYTQKGVASHPDSYRRLFLEIFTYLSVAELLQIAGRVCRTWYDATWQDDTWQYRGTNFTPSSLSYRAQYVISWIHDCMYCGKHLKNEEIHTFCPIHNRPVCYPCYSIEENRPQYVQILTEMYSLDPAVLKKLPIRVFNFQGYDCVYYPEASSTIAKARFSLCQEILSQETLELVSLFGEETFQILHKATERDFGICEFPHLLNQFSTYQVSNPLFDFISQLKSIKQFPRLISSIRNH